MKTTIAIRAVALLAALLAASMTVAEPTVTVSATASGNEVALGDMFSLTISALIEEPMIVGWGLDVLVVGDEPSIAFCGASMGDAWMGFTAPDEPETYLDLAAVAKLEIPYGGKILAAIDPIELVTISFLALGPGEVSFTFGAGADDPTEGFPAYPVGFAEASFPAEAISVSIVPEPVAVAALALGVPTLMRRRR